MDYFDLHCDTPYECYFKNKDFYENDLSVSGKKGELFDNWKQVFAVWIRDDLEKPFEAYQKILNSFKEKLKKSPTNLTPYFAVEGGAVIEKNLSRIELLKNDGIRFLTLTWNGENNIAGGVKSDKALTDFGKEAIKELNRLKIGCDLSHLNKKSFYKAVEIADYPLATHSNCRAVLDAERNLTDEQIKLIAQKRGIIGLCLYPEFLGKDVFNAIYKNIYHLLELGFENNIAIGSDFDGAKMDTALNDISKIPSLYKCLEQKGIEKPILNKIFYKNAENYLEKRL